MGLGVGVLAGAAVLLIFKGENVSTVGLQDHVFWCEQSNFILRELMSSLNFVSIN